MEEQLTLDRIRVNLHREIDEILEDLPDDPLLRYHLKNLGLAKAEHCHPNDILRSVSNVVEEYMSSTQTIRQIPIA